MKIAFVEPHLGLYGGIRRVLEFSNRFVARGAEVVVYHPAGTPCEWMECRARVRPLREADAAGHDVVIFNNPPDYRVVRHMRARVKVFYILELYDKDRLLRFDPKVLWPRKGRMLSLKRALQMPFLRVCNATWMQRWLREHLRMETEVQFGGVNRDLFHPVPGLRTPGTFTVLFSGDPREHKGTATVVAAVERVRRSHPSLVLETYHGRGIAQEHMAACYSRADLFVDAQWHAGWNNPVIESMACGTPVVCSDIGGVEDFAFHERTALVVPARDVDGFARAIERALADAPLRDALRTRALTYLERFDWETATDEFLARLGAAVDRAPTGRGQ